MKYEYETCQYCIHNGNCEDGEVIQKLNKYDEFDDWLKCEAGIYHYFKEIDKQEAPNEQNNL